MGIELPVNYDIVKLHIEFAKNQRVLQYLVQLDRRAMGLLLPREAEQIQHDVMGALRLFVEFFQILRAAALDEFLGLQQLAVTKDRGERIVQLMRDPGDQLAHRRHLLALQELLLGTSQRVVSFARFFEQQRFVDGGGDLVADGRMQIQLGGGERSRIAVAHDQHPHDAILGPQDHDLRFLNSFLVVQLANFLRQRGQRAGQQRGPGLANLIELAWRNLHGEFGACGVGFVTHRSGAPQHTRGLIEQIDGSGAYRK